MGVKKLAVLGAALAVAAPAFALEPFETVPSTMFYVRMPLGATTAKERTPSFGLAIQGRRQYETVTIDSRMFRYALMEGIEAKWLIAGGLAATAVVVVATKDKKTSSNYNQAQNAPCPDPNNICGR
jgi:hypothetical protein